MAIGEKAKPYKTAEVFLEALQPGGRILREIQDDPNYSESRGIFWRGQWDATQNLVPSALGPKKDKDQWFHRDPKWNLYANQLPIHEPEKQIEYEAALLKRFVDSCDDRGPVVPEDGQALRTALMRFTDYQRECVCMGLGKGSIEDWPPLEVRSALALAQHEGVPTRLVDFTYEPLVALYFAAEGVFRHEAKDWNGDLAIWCIPDRILNLARDKNGTISSEYREFRQRLQIVSAPGSSNKNLLYQRGLFLLDQSPRQKGELRNPVNLLDALPDNLPPVLKFTLPQTEAPKLLDLLMKWRYHYAALFPTYDGIIEGERREHKLRVLLNT